MIDKARKIGHEAKRSRIGSLVLVLALATVSFAETEPSEPGRLSASFVVTGWGLRTVDGTSSLSLPLPKRATIRFEGFDDPIQLGTCGTSSLRVPMELKVVMNGCQIFAGKAAALNGLVVCVDGTKMHQQTELVLQRRLTLPPNITAGTYRNIAQLVICSY